MTKSATIPITNFYANGDYTAQLAVGSEGTLVNLILDTGSSTLAVKASKYSPVKDNALQPTSFAQDVSYGTGGWAGPLVKTKVSFGVNQDAIALDQAYLAITNASLPDNFGNADGILGLAYKGLNQAYNLSAFFQLHEMPVISFPWPFTVANSSTGLSQLMALFQTLQFEDIPPYFEQLKQQTEIANKFAFAINKSTIDLSQWPTLYFILSGLNGADVRLAVAPQTYWQFDAVAPGLAVFVIESGGMPQSILGLPLMNNYYTVFDRSLDAYGVVKFATINAH